MSNKIAIVTGANKGIGYEIVKLLASDKNFSTVYLGSRDVERGSSAVKSIGSEKVKLLQIDLQDANVTAVAVEQVTKEISPSGVDVLINNAGFAFKTDATENFGIQARVSNDINYYGTKMVTDKFLPLINPGGRIVNVASRAGSLDGWKSASLLQLIRSSGSAETPLRFQVLEQQILEPFIKAAGEGSHQKLGYPNSAYGTSKAGMIALTRIYASTPEIVDKGILVNACCPGWCQTDMSSMSGNKTAAEGADTPYWLAVDPDLNQSGGFYGERQLLKW